MTSKSRQHDVYACNERLYVVLCDYTEHSRISVAVCTFYIQQNYNNLSARKEKLLTFFCNLMTEVHFFSKSPAYFLSTSSFY